MRMLAPQAREAVAQYIMGQLPRDISDGRDGWKDYAVTAYQFGCQALDALGYAQLAPWGATRLTPPTTPMIMPRWDDVCFVTLVLLDQEREIDFRNLDGSVYKPPMQPGQVVLTPVGTPPLPAPNIGATNGLGPAFVRPKRLSLLETLGLVTDGHWGKDAEAALWRKQPRAWAIPEIDDPQFNAGLQRCLDTMPEEVVETLHDLSDITATEIDLEIERHQRAVADFLARNPGQAAPQPKVTRERALSTLISTAKGAIDRDFVDRWRLADGWLADDAAPAALTALFHDPPRPTNARRRV